MVKLFGDGGEFKVFKLVCLGWIDLIGEIFGLVLLMIFVVFVDMWIGFVELFKL